MQPSVLETRSSGTGGRSGADMGNGPTLLVDEEDFRIVATGDGMFVLEVTDGADALGVERWRTFQTNGTHLRAIFGYLIRVAQQVQKGKDTT